MDLKAGALETDIKSLKKAARQTVGPELQKRIQSNYRFWLNRNKK